MIVIRFPDEEVKGRALGYLFGRFSFKSWANGEMMMSEEVLAALSAQGIRHVVQGPATYEHLIPSVRVAAADKA